MTLMQILMSGDANVAEIGKSHCIEQLASVRTETYERTLTMTAAVRCREECTVLRPLGKAGASGTLSPCLWPESA